MRLSSSTIYQKNTDSIIDGQSKWQKTGLNLGTGKKIATPSDDPVGSTKALTLKQDRSILGQYETTIRDLKNSLNFQDRILGSSVEVISKIRESLVYAGNETLSDDDRESLATALQGMKNQLTSLANSRDANGRYSFAGTKNDKPPFVVDESGKVSYAGGKLSMNVSVNATRNVAIGFTGIEAFMSGTTVTEPDGSLSQKNVFDSIDYALDALKLKLQDNVAGEHEQFRTLLDKALRGIDNSINNIGTIRAAGGSLLAEFDKLDDLGASLDVDFQTQISDVEDVDYSKATSDYMRQQAGLEAAQKTFLYMQNMSLFKKG